MYGLTDLESSICDHLGGYLLDVVPGHKVLWPFSLFGWIVPSTNYIDLRCGLVAEEANRNLGEPQASQPGIGNQRM